MNSGSDTETDDELYERQDYAQQIPVEAPVSAGHEAPSVLPGSAVVATNDAIVAAQPAGTETVATSQQERVSEVQERTTNAKRVAPPVPPSLAALLSPVVDSDDDEPPRFEPTPSVPTCHQTWAPVASTAHNQAALPSHVKVSPPAQIAISTREATTAKQEPVATPSHAPVRASTPPTAAPWAFSRPAPSQAPLATTHHPVPVYTPTPAAPVGLPSSAQFKSPFSSLATQYQPPPTPIVGAPPTSYVPLRRPPVYGGPPASYAPVPPLHRTPTIPCSTCSRVLPENASPIPLPGHGTCACCRRYFPSLIVRESESRPFCTACVAPRPAAPRTAAPPAPYVTTALTSMCGKCMRTLTPSPPKPGTGIKCRCCHVYYAKKSFSKMQRRTDVLCRSCATGKKMADEAEQNRLRRAKKQENIRQRAEQTKQTNANQSAKKNAPARGQSTISTEATPAQTPSSLTPPRTATGSSIPPPGLSQATPEERHEMEVDVRNIKLARRSIHRRRRANDLRGSTRVEYEEQLLKEEGNLDQKMVRMRRRNPALFDWLNQNLEVRGALGIAPSEWDHPAKGKKKQKQQSEQHAKKKKAPPAQKRKASGGAKAAPSHPKRPRTTAAPKAPARAPASPVMGVKPEVKGEAKSVNVPTGYEAARARRAKPIEVIDLVDSD